MENSSPNLVAVEELLIAVQIPDNNDVVVVGAQAVVDLAPFNLTPQEIQKFQKIFRSMNAKLAESFQEPFTATSVISEIRSK
ncbi:MAG: hypothetical protein V7L30_33200 [Nostoc sp.]|uniref:hypothetical protein n=1 Tax=Nostoc sp. TaxID=1180 RepID=UPI002FF9F565